MYYLDAKTRFRRMNQHRMKIIKQQLPNISRPARCWEFTFFKCEDKFGLGKRVPPGLCTVLSHAKATVFCSNSHAATHLRLLISTCLAASRRLGFSFCMVSATGFLKSGVYRLFGTPFGIKITPSVRQYITCLTNGVPFTPM